MEKVVSCKAVVSSFNNTAVTGGGIAQTFHRLISDDACLLVSSLPNFKYFQSSFFSENRTY